MSTEGKFINWLRDYFSAWENGDSVAVLRLFSEDAEYYETPFDAPMVGHEAIRKYWEDGARDGQRNIQTSFHILLFRDDKGWAHWTATFEREKDGSQVQLDGMLKITFDKRGKATRLDEWWHRNETKN